MPFVRATWVKHGILILGLMALPCSIFAGGVTVITHGFNGTTSGWVTGMANAISDRAGNNVPIYRLLIDESLSITASKISGGDPLLNPHGSLIVLLDWGPVSRGSVTTLAVAALAAPAFIETNLIPELGGHALAELPIHLIGHSRGSSLMCELSRKLGEQGVWVDQVTGLDSAPLNGDAPAVSYENVLFCDSYYQKENLLVNGDPIPGAFWRKQTAVSGGYEGLFNGHSDTHLWYHGTATLDTPASDSEASITDTMRASWWSPSEQSGTNAGFTYTLLGAGNRLDPSQPNGGNSSPVRDGFNRYFDVGGGAGQNNRTALTSNSGGWPNPIRFELLTTNRVQQGDTASLGIHFQWAQPNTSTQSVQLLADPDLNPLNGNEVLLDEGYVTGTTATQVEYGMVDVEFDGSTLPAGNYALLVRMAYAGRTRCLYAPQWIQLGTSTQPLVMDIAATTGASVFLSVNGVVGQTAVIETSLDGLPWLPLTTNLLTSSRWEIEQPVDAAATIRLFRASLVTP